MRAKTCFDCHSKSIDNLLHNLHRYNIHMENVGVPTFFRRPMALTPEDLKAAKVDVAIFGAPSGWMSPAGAGNHWGPQFVRAQFGNGMYGSVTAPLSPIDVETLIEPFNIINVVDYGDAAADPWNLVRSQSELRRITREIAETGAVPLAIGGDHSVPTGTYRGIADVYLGNAKRATAQPTTEMMLRAFVGLTLTVVIQAGQQQRHVTSLNPVQQRILQLLDFSAAIYQNLIEQLFEPLIHLREP